jgi:hypothetical protein
VIVARRIADQIAGGLVEVVGRDKHRRDPDLAVDLDEPVAVRDGTGVAGWARPHDGERVEDAARAQFHRAYLLRLAIWAEDRGRKGHRGTLVASRTRRTS